MVATQESYGGRQRSWRNAWIVWGVGCLAYCAALFHRASMGVAASDALQRFSAGPGVLALFSALQLGVYLAWQVPSGLLADRLGPRKVITGAVLALALGSLVFGVASSVVGGIAGRVLIGFGDAFLFTNVLRLAAQWFPVRLFGKVAALTGLAGGMGQLVSTVPLTASLHEFGWTPTFAAAAAVTAVLVLVAAVVIRDRPGSARGPIPEPDVRERVSDALRAVVAQRGSRHSFWVHFVLMAQFVAVTTLWGSPWLVQAQGFTRSQAGDLLLLCVAGFIAGSWLCGQFVAGRPARRERYTLGLSCAAVLMWTVIVAWPDRLPPVVVMFVLAVIGVSGGAAMLAFDGARAANAIHRSGTATGVVNMGGFAGAVLVQLLVGAVLQEVSWMPAVSAYRWAFAPVVVVLVVGTLAQAALRCSVGESSPGIGVDR